MKSYYWLVLGDSAGRDVFGELFQSRDDECATNASKAEAMCCLPPGEHRIAVSRVRGDGTAFVVWSGDVRAGVEVACA